jgi:hypothetical protein
MIYSLPNDDEPIDQGDVIDECPVASITHHQVGRVDQSRYAVDLHRVIVLTQTCDLAQAKTKFVVVASVYDAQAMIDDGLVKASDVKGPIRAGRIFGLYFLPAKSDASLGEMIVDLHRLHTVGIEFLDALRLARKRRIRLLTPYREHLAKHFADTYSRIGLPEPYETT